MSSNIPAAPAYGVYISQLIRYSRACASYQDFIDKGLQVTRKLLSQGLSLRKFFGRHHDLVDRYEISISQMTIDISLMSFLYRLWLTSIVILHSKGKHLPLHIFIIPKSYCYEMKVFYSKTSFCAVQFCKISQSGCWELMEISGMIPETIWFKA